MATNNINNLPDKISNIIAAYNQDNPSAKLNYNSRNDLPVQIRIKYERVEYYFSFENPNTKKTVKELTVRKLQEKFGEECIFAPVMLIG